MVYNPREKANAKVDIIKKGIPAKKVVAKPTEATKDSPIATALADIEKRGAERRKAAQENNSRLVAARKKRREEKGTIQSGSDKLQGLASLRNTLGKQYYRQPDSENS